MAQPTDLSPAAQELRRHDPDRFLTALFAPQELRDHLFALYAFNSELARIPDIVTEPLIGMMRFQWWQDRVTDIFEGRGAPKGHPVAEGLEKAIVDGRLPREPLDRLIEARERDLHKEPMPDRKALMEYAEGTGGSLALLAYRLLAGAGDETAEAAASRVGTAYALAGLLRSVRSNARAGRVHLPESELNQAGSSAQDVLEGRDTEDVRGAVRAVADQARELLTEARRAVPAPGRRSVAAFLPAVLAEGYLDRLRALAHNPFDPRLAIPRRRPIVLSFRAWRGRY